MRTLVALLVSVALAACSGAESDGPSDDGAAVADARGESIGSPDRRTLRDADAERVYALMREALDSDTGWRRTRYVEFDWVLWRGAPILTRSYRFAPWDGDFRVETDLNGQRMVALGNWNTPTAPRVWMDGEEIEGDSAVTLRRRAERMFELDANQLLLPFRWDDIRISARYVGPSRTEDGRSVEVVELTETGTVRGDTPRHVFHIDAESGLPLRTVTYASEEDEGTAYAWEDWEEHGPILLSTRRVAEVGSEIRFLNIGVSPSIPDDRFVPPN